MDKIGKIFNDIRCKNIVMKDFEAPKKKMKENIFTGLITEIHHHEIVRVL